MLCRFVLVCVVAILFGFALEPGPARATPLLPSAAAEAVKPDAPVELARWFFFRRHHYRRRHFRRHRVRRHRSYYSRHHHRRGRHVRVERRDRVPAAEGGAAPTASFAPPKGAGTPGPVSAPSRSSSGAWVEPAKVR